VKTLFAQIAGWQFINAVRRNSVGGYEYDYATFALPGGGRMTKGQLEAWALANKQEVRYWYV